MASNVIDVRTDSKRLEETLRKLPSLVNNPGTARDAMNALKVRVGLQALSFIRDAFKAKARGGTDEAGDRWPPLQKSTIAYSRRHPGVLFPGKKRAPFRPSWMLTKKQRARWWELNAEVGAAMAWIILKKEGAKTLIGEYGDTKVEILRNTGLLLNSLSPGTSPDNATSSPPSREGQIFKLNNDNVYVGTNRKHAGVHHKGIPGKIPQRRLWPKPNRWPTKWWDLLLSQARHNLINVVSYLLRR